MHPAITSQAQLRTAYGDWLIALVVGVLLWYRNTAQDRILGLLLIGLSLLFMIAYALCNNIDPATAKMVITGSLVLVIVAIAILVACCYNQEAGILVAIVAIGFIALIATVDISPMIVFGIAIIAILVIVALAAEDIVLLSVSLVVGLVLVAIGYHEDPVYSRSSPIVWIPLLLLLIGLVYWIVSRPIGNV